MASSPPRSTKGTSHVIGSCNPPCQGAPPVFRPELARFRAIGFALEHLVQAVIRLLHQGIDVWGRGGFCSDRASVSYRPLLELIACLYMESSGNVFAWCSCAARFVRPSQVQAFVYRHPLVIQRVSRPRSHTVSRHYASQLAIPTHVKPRISRCFPAQLYV